MDRYRFDKENHIHLLYGEPLCGTSSVTGILNKPGLTYWASGKALELLGWTNKKTKKAERLKSADMGLSALQDIGRQDFLDLLDKCYGRHKESLAESADKGIDLHWCLEQYVLEKMGNTSGFLTIDSESLKRIEPFILWSEQNVAVWLWSEAHCYNEELWVGGICDAGALLKNGKCVVIDFKSSKEAYSSHFFQCAGYTLCIESSGLLDNVGNVVYCNYEGQGDLSNKVKIDDFIVFPFGAKELKPWYPKQGIGEYKRGFKNLAEVYSILKKEGD